MANRVPLIVDTTTLNIKELPSGDNLDLTGSGIHNAGVITATTFSGSFTGDVTGSASSITVAAETSDTTCSIVFVTAATGALPPKTSTGLTYDSANSNVTIGGSLTVANNISIGGTIQYQDVTNVESLGIITARKGINIGPADAGAYLTGIGASFNHVGDFITVGVSTFQGNIDANGNLDVDGQTDLDVLNVSDTATFSGALNANGGIACDTNKFTVADTSGNTTIAGTLDVDGQTDLDVLNVAETATFSALTKIRQGINIGPSDAGGYGTGIGATFTHAGDFITVGVSTFRGDITRQGSGAAQVRVGSTNAGGATLVLDGDSNGDFSGDDYSFIRHNTDGNLVIKANSPGTANCYIQLGADGDYGAMFKEGAESLLRYDNSTKIETTFTGAIVTGIATATSFHVGDGTHSTDRISIGDSNDLALYHNASNSFIVDRGTGPLYIRGNKAVRIESYTNDSAGEPMIVGNSDSSVDIYYDNVVKFATSGVGASVYGTGVLKIPVGTTAQRPGVGDETEGDIRYNTTLNSYEGYGNGAWGGLGGGTEIDHPVAGTTATGIGTFAHASYRSASFRVQITQGSAYQVGKYLLIHDGTTATVVEESAIATGSMLGTITAAIVSANVVIYVTMDSSASATVTSVIDKITV